MVNAIGATHEYVSRLGIKEGQLTQEVGWGTDYDSTISESVENFLDIDLLDEDTDEAVDVALLRWREEDDDLVDDPVNAPRPLEDENHVWLLISGVGQPGAIDSGVIDGSVQLAGFSNALAFRLRDWQGNCLVQCSSQPTLAVPLESAAS